MAAELSILVSIYKGEPYLPAFFENLQAQTCFPKCELILVANEPSTSEEQLLAEFKFKKQVRVLRVSPKESLGASWNRAWKAAQAPYVAIWNIDDRRPADGLERQLAAIRDHDWLICYGDYIRVSAYGDESGELRRTPEYSPQNFARSFAQGGAFWVLRRELCERAGYFDEQLQVAADMDLSLRAAVLGLPMGKAPGLVGYFTDASLGLSTREGGRPARIERTVVQLRYGVYDKVNPDLRAATERYRVDEIQNFGQWILLSEWIPAYAHFLQQRNRLWALGKLRHTTRKLLARLGLLDALHRLQAWLFGREI